MRPPESKTRPVGVLAIALGVAVLVLAAFDGGADDEAVTLVRPATDVSTEPTALGEVIERSTTLPPSPTASPATFALTADDPAAVNTGGSPSTDRPGASTSPTLGPPVSITSPSPPRTTTTTAPTTSTTEDSTTTTEESTTTTEASTTTTTEETTTTTT